MRMCVYTHERRDGYMDTYNSIMCHEYVSPNQLMKVITYTFYHTKNIKIKIILKKN